MVPDVHGKQHSEADAMTTESTNPSSGEPDAPTPAGTSDAALLLQVLKAFGLPAADVVIGDVADRESWRISWEPTATSWDVQCGDLVRQAFDRTGAAKMLQDQTPASFDLLAQWLEANGLATPGRGRIVVGTMINHDPENPIWQRFGWAR